MSFDEGGAWQPFSLDLPVTPVHGVLVKGDDLVIGTHGRSFYVMDNINVLRQIGKDTTSEAVVLFKPGDAIRSVSRGVAVDYYLKQPADKVTIEFLDPQGKVIKSFTGTCRRAGDAAAGRRGRHHPSGAAAAGGEAGAEPLRVGHALSRREGLQGPDHVGRQRARPGARRPGSTRCG